MRAKGSESITVGDVSTKPGSNLVGVGSESASPVADRNWATHRAQLWQDTSSWLTSLVLHLIWFILITSISVPWAGQAGIGERSPLSLVMGFADEDGESQAVEFSTSTGQDGQDAQAQATAAEQPVEQPSENTGRSTETLNNDSAEAADEAPEPPSPQTAETNLDSPSQYSQWLQQRLDEPINETESSRYAAILHRTRSAPRSTPHRPTDSGMTMVAAAHRYDLQQQEYDRIVDDFIAYDIGQLRGKAGQEARRRFMELGPDSIPALVRGLNKSASIHASCPVGVLAGKLIQALRSVQDPSLTDYAIDHVGRGVPDDAPHYRRIMALRRRWLGNLQDVSDPVVTVVARQTLEDDGQLLELVLALADAPAETLLAAIDSGDVRLSSAAMIALTQSTVALPSQKRRLIIGALSRISTTSKSSQEQALAREALQVVRARQS